MPLPPVEVATPLEPYSPPLSVTSCDPEPKPGVVAFRDFVMAHLGGLDFGISRDCGVGSGSEHHEGRAWDWGMDANNPLDEARVEELLDWLLAPDLVTGEPHANFRRTGLRYVIWNHHIWSAANKNWTKYSGPHPHTDHMHFSWGWPGARAETSFYDWLSGPETPPVGVAGRRPGWAPALVAGLGIAIGWQLLSYAQRG